MKLLVLFITLCHFSQIFVKGQIISCYWTSWSNERVGAGRFNASNVNPNLCTHLNYAFVGISDNGNIQGLGSALVERAVALKRVNPRLKVLASVGGGAEGSARFTVIAADPTRRSRFITSSLNYIRNNNLDGMDLDWEFPTERGGRPVDRSNFIVLLRQIRAAFKPYSLLLTVAVSPLRQTVRTAYNVTRVARNVDFINVMTYDFHVSTDGYTGFNAPLPEVKQGINLWLRNGAPAKKLVLGIGSYGYSYQLANSSNHRPGDKSVGPGAAGPILHERGTMGFNEICLLNWRKNFSTRYEVPYAHQGNQWVGYDNVRSVELKMNFAISKNLGGAMMWSIDTDDFRGRCGESYPLLKTMNRAFGRQV